MLGYKEQNIGKENVIQMQNEIELTKKRNGNGMKSVDVCDDVIGYADRKDETHLDRIRVDAEESVVEFDPNATYDSKEYINFFLK